MLFRSAESLPVNVTFQFYIRLTVSLQIIIACEEVILRMIRSSPLRKLFLTVV